MEKEDINLGKQLKTELLKKKRKKKARDQLLMKSNCVLHTIYSYFILSSKYALTIPISV